MTISFFRRPVKTVTPCRDASVTDLWRYIRSPYARQQTGVLRTLPPEERRGYKQRNFDFCTPGGLFSSRKIGGLVATSGYLVVDVDHVSDPRKLLQSVIFDLSPALAFVSPSGDGCKFLLDISEDMLQLTGYRPKEVIRQGDGQKVANAYKGLFSHLATWWESYAPESPIDESGSDISRACYLPCDPLAYIGEKLLIWKQ